VKKYLSLFAMIVGLIVASITIIMLLNLTNPTSAGSFGVLLVFANIYLITFLVSMIIVSFSRMVYAAIRTPRQTALSSDKKRIFRRKIVAVVAILNFAPIFFISMNSIGQLNFINISLFFAIETVVIFYALRWV
jgi:hypothetical protein